MALYLEIGRPWNLGMVRMRSGVRAPASAPLFYRNFTAARCTFLSKVVLVCPSGEGNGSSAQESKMALCLEIGRSWGPAMVSERFPGSSPRVGFSSGHRDGAGCALGAAGCAV
jgi:hypothetical protein